MSQLAKLRNGDGGQEVVTLVLHEFEKVFREEWYDVNSIIACYKGLTNKKWYEDAHNRELKNELNRWHNENYEDMSSEVRRALLDDTLDVFGKKYLDPDKHISEVKAIYKVLMSH